MKYLLTMLWLAFAAAVSAQNPSLAYQLEGRWHGSTGQQTLLMHWDFTDNCLGEGEISAVFPGNDTARLGRFQVKISDREMSLLFWDDTRRDLQPAVLRPAKSARHEAIWENTDPAATPARIEWAFLSGGQCQFDFGSGVMTFKKMKSRERDISPSVQIQFSGGSFFENKFLFYTPGANLKRDILPVADVSLLFGLKMKHAPVRLNFSAGIASWETRFQASGSGINDQFSLDLRVRKTQLHAGFLPEIIIGKKEKLSVITGFEFWLKNYKPQITSVLNQNAPQDMLTTLTNGSVNSYGGAVLGFSWQVNDWFSVLGKSFWTSEWRQQNNKRWAINAVNLGVGFRLGK